MGVCNICGSHGKLTEDHTPPKGCVRITAVEMRSLVHRLCPEEENVRARIGQSGLKYRTLCERCNNTLLGGRYDPALINFVNTVGGYLKTKLHLPSSLTIPAEPQKIMRSVLGHLCALGVDRYQKGNNTEPIRDYILNENEFLPANIHIYCWPFPYKDHVLIRDAAMTDLRIHAPLVFWLMKFFPLAFFITFNAVPEYSFGQLNELSVFRNEKIDSVKDIRIILSPVVHSHWPEAPDNNRIVMYGQEAICAGIKPKRKRS